MLTRKEKTNYLRIGLALVGISVDNRTAETITKIYDGVLLKKGGFSLKDAVDIEFEVGRQYAQNSIKSRTKKSK